MNLKHLNQKGMSAIIFAMVFVVVLSLLAVGFTTLVRNDQRQVLDKTLSYQAQYAAETAINRKTAELQADPTLADSINCPTFNLSDSSSNASATISCLTWTSKLDALQKLSLGTDPFITQLTPDSGSFDTITITWKPHTAVALPGTYTGPVANLPAIDSSKKPILRLAIANDSASSPVRVAYLVPSNLGSPLPAGFNGTIATTVCTTAADCSITIPFNSSRANISLTSYGSIADITGIKVTSSGVAKKLVGAQAEIDANARAQDITKRIIARVSLLPQTWNPGYALSADSVCKDYVVDGNQNKSASTGSAPACFAIP